MKKHKGFTLIELLAVIVILGILLSISAVAIGKIKNKQDEENYKNVLSSILTGAKRYIADHPEKLDTSCTGNKVDNDKMVACSDDCTRVGKCTLISVQGLINNGYVDIDEENSLYNDLIKTNTDNTFSSRSVRIEKCSSDTSDPKLVYKLYDLRGGTKKYNDCGCEEQEASDEKAGNLCIDTN